MSQSSAGSTSSSSTGNMPGLENAQAMYWITFFIFLVTIFVGLGWDRRWHTTHKFETFYSPPHLFIYGTSLLATLLVAVIVFSPNLRRWFGPGFRLFPFPFEIPGALVLLGGGFVLQGVAGLVFDNFWHSTFGLDETGWSFPHSMLGWTFFITLLGFVACRLALRPYRPLQWYTAMLLGFLVIGFSAKPFIGPLDGNRTPETVRAIAAIPVLLNQASVQHTFRIYLSWNLTRTNPLFIPLSVIWAGVALALIRGLDKRARVWLTVAFLWEVFSLLSGLREVRGLDRLFHFALTRDLATWLSPPLFLAALIVAILLWLGLPERWAWIGWILAGWVFGFFTLLIWRAHPLGFVLTILAGPLMALGAFVGGLIYRILEKPTRWMVLGFLTLAGVGAPLMTGIVDLFLRKVTP